MAKNLQFCNFVAIQIATDFMTITNIIFELSTNDYFLHRKSLRGVRAIVMHTYRSGTRRLMQQPLQLFDANDDCPPTVHLRERKVDIKLER